MWYCTVYLHLFTGNPGEFFEFTRIPEGILGDQPFDNGRTRVTVVWRIWSDLQIVHLPVRHTFFLMLIILMLINLLYYHRFRTNKVNSAYLNLNSYTFLRFVLNYWELYNIPLPVTLSLSLEVEGLNKVYCRHTLYNNYVHNYLLL